MPIFLSKISKKGLIKDYIIDITSSSLKPSGEIPSCPHNALLEILSRNHARVVPDGFLRDLPVSRPALLIVITIQYPGYSFYYSNIYGM